EEEEVADEAQLDGALDVEDPPYDALELGERLLDGRVLDRIELERLRGRIGDGEQLAPHGLERGAAGDDRSAGALAHDVAPSRRSARVTALRTMVSGSDAARSRQARAAGVPILPS